MIMDSVLKTFKLIVHENLGLFILNCKRKDEILKAYASQKYTMKREKKNNNIFFIAQTIQDVYSITEKSLMNYLVISFKTLLLPKTLMECIEQKLVIFFDFSETQTEIESRRYISSCNKILESKLGISCNDLSNLRFINRNVEILIHNDIIINNDDDDNNNNNSHYRCIIDYNRGFSIQMKHYFDQKEAFIEEIYSFELLRYSLESPIFDDRHYFIIHSKEKTIIGLASFLDCNNVSVKTTYLNDNQGTILYQRITLDDYKNPQPFILEHEFENGEKRNLKSLKRYFDISCRLSAKLPYHLIKNGYSNVSSKPIHINDSNNDDDDDDNELQYKFYKLDGILATLKFYNNHFIVTNNMKSESFPHKLPKCLIHRLKDFSFLVESNLYQSLFPAINKPNPMAIIDLHTSSFSAIERMTIIQKLKVIMAKSLEYYFIYFQGENVNNNNNMNIYPGKSLNYLPLYLKEYIEKRFVFFINNNNNNNNNDNNDNDDNKFKLEHGKIYEVCIDRNNQITKIIKPRPDKLYPNSRKCIETIKQSLSI